MVARTCIRLKVLGTAVGELLGQRVRRGCGPPHDRWAAPGAMSQHPKSAQYAGMAAGRSSSRFAAIESYWLFAWVCRCVDVIMERCCGTIDL